MPLSPDEMNYALMMGRTVSDSGEASSPVLDALKAMGLDPSIHNRPSIIPTPDKRSDGTLDLSNWTAPEWWASALGAAVTPGIAAQGIPTSPVEGANFALNVAGAGMGAGSAAKAPSGSLGMFVGEKARGVNLEKLAEAKLLIAAKQSPEFVWKDTGWMQGKGGHWMTEIPDREMAWLPQSDSATTVQEAIRHHPLFTAYPQLKGVGFKFDKLGGNTAGSVDENGIKLSDELINGGRYQRSVYQTMIHELQHQVQQIEGWPTGGNVRSVDARPHLYDPASANAYEELAAAQSNPAVAIPEYVALEQKFNAAKDTYRNSKPAIERYRNLAGEAQARQSAARYWLTEQERLERYPGRSDVHLSETGIAPSDVVNNPHVPFAGGGVVKALDKLLSYYHGSDVKGISVLDPLYGLGRRTEGKAVWVKPSPEEAAGYVKKGSGSVYRVDVDPTDFAHLDANFTSNKAIHPEAMIVHHNGETTPISSLGNKVTTDDVAAHARSMGDKGIHIHNVADMGSGPYGALADGPHGQSTAIFAPVKTIEERPAKLIAQDPTPFAEGGSANVPNPSPEADALAQRTQDPQAAKMLNLDLMTLHMADGGQVSQDEVKASPRNLFQDIVGTAGGWLANAGEQTSNAMDTIRDTHPARSALVDLLLADQLKNAGTALQDWTGTQRSIDAPDIQYTPSPIHGGSTLQTFKFDPRALDVAATVQPLASAAMKGARAAVPFAKDVAEMGFELAMQGKIPGMPAMASYVVPPQGNLNLTPVVNAQLLKGPEKQTVESFSKQLIGTPGVTGKGITEATSHLDPKSVGSKTDFADALAPSKYEKIDLHGTVVDPTLIDTAHELVEPEGLIQSLNVPERYVDNFQQFMDGEVALNELPRPLQQRLRKTGMDTPTAAGDAYRELYEEAMFQKVRELTEEAEPITHADTQRLAGHELESADNTAGYFEIGVTHPSFNAHPGKHFENAPKSLVGHVRGTFLDDFMESYPGAENDILYLPKPLPNSAMIEEIQADAAKAHGKHPALHQISATLFKAAVQHALENGVDHVYVPTAHTIGVARESSALKYEPIYDNEVLKDGISPLMRVPGVTVQTALVPGESDKIAYHVISFSPEAKAHLKEIGQATPGYKKGGAVHFAEGGDVDAMQAEIKAYDPTWRETMAQYLQQGAEGLGISRPIARRATQSITGGPESALPIQMGIADIVPFLGTALQTQEAVRGGKRAVDAAQRGDFGEAAIEGGAAALGMIPGAVGTKRVIDKVAPFANRVGDMLSELAAKGYIPGAPSYGSHVIKPKGGNWLPGSVERKLDQLRPWEPEQLRPELAAELGLPPPADMSANDALNRWIDRRLIPYVKNDMGTPGDPVRALAEKGTLHFEPKTHATGSLSDDWVKGSRAGEGFPPEGLGQSQLAKDWEYYTDSSIVPYPASVKQENARLVEQHPWIAKLEPESRINQPLSYWDNSKFGFNHLTDELQNALNPTSGLPQNLLIEPDKLGKMTMPDVVQHVAKINEWRAQNAGKVALQLTEGMPVRKEYPEQGFKWLELAAPKDAKSVDDGFGNMSTPGYSELEKALKYEGDTMGHCVGAYCDDVASGQTRIYSLRDKNNEPHVTIEVSPNPYAPRWDAVKPYLPQAEELLRSKGITNADEEEISQLATQLAKENAPPHIVQIKGKGNAAPNDKYLPFVQDFVKSGNWGEVGDLENSGLRHRANVFNDAEQARIAAAGHALPEYMTPDEIKAINQKVWPDAGPAPTEPSGMKKGGKVKFANNINDMRAALALGT